jgi:hypothetical protein
MTNLDDRAPPAIGVYWIKKEDYSMLLRLFDDGDKMPGTWKEWLKSAEEMEGDSRPTDTSSCAFTSTRTPLRLGAPPTVRTRAAKDAKGSSPRP